MKTRSASTSTSLSIGPAALLLLATCWNTVCWADEPGYLYVKNNHDREVFIWVNGIAQGVAPAGRTCMMPQDGFVTPDSGIQPDGSVVTKHAYGGWGSSPTLTVKAASWTTDKEADDKSKEVAFTWTGSGIPAWVSSSAGVWIGGGPKITEADLEIAIKMPSGKPSQTLILELPKAVNEPPAKLQSTGGSAGGGPFVTSWSGANLQKSIPLSGVWKNMEVINGSTFDWKVLFREQGYFTSSSSDTINGKIFKASRDGKYKFDGKS